jgi:hypothetical protein
VEVPVFISDGEGIQGAQFQISYNPGLLTYKKATAGPVGQGFFSAGRSNGSFVKVAMASMAPFAGQGTAVMATLAFAVPESVPPGSSCVLSVNGVVLVGRSGRLETATKPGVFRVNGKARDTSTPVSDEPSSEVPSDNTDPNEETGAPTNYEGLSGDEIEDRPTQLEQLPGIDPLQNSFHQGGGTYGVLPNPSNTPVTSLPEPTLPESKAHVTVPAWRCDLNFDGIVGERDVLIFLEFVGE